jgi:hypothetical protein
MDVCLDLDDPRGGLGIIKIKGATSAGKEEINTEED